MKRSLAFILTAVMLALALASCGETVQPATTPTPAQQSTAEPTNGATTEAPTSKAPTSEAPTSEAPSVETPTPETPLTGNSGVNLNLPLH